MGKYAAETKVSIERSRAELEKILGRFGADQVMVAYEPASGNGVVRFRASGRLFSIEVRMPSRDKFKSTPTGLLRYGDAIDRAWEQGKRSHWRGIVLWIKAIHVAIEMGVLTLEQAFLPYTLLPEGETVAQWLEPQVQTAYETGQMPSLVPGLPALTSGEGRG